MTIHPRPSRSVPQAQAVYAALMLGTLSAAGAMAAVRLSSAAAAPQAAQAGMWGVILSAITGACLIAALVVPSRFVARARRESSATGSVNPDSFVFPYTTAVIVRGALLESPGLFGAVAFLITGEWWTLGSTGLALLLMAATFPSRAGLERFAADASRPEDLFPSVHPGRDRGARR